MKQKKWPFVHFICTYISNCWLLRSGQNYMLQRHADQCIIFLVSKDWTRTFFFRKSKKCVRLIFTGRIVPLPDLALEFSWTRNENIEYQFVTSVHHPNQLFSCGRAGRIGEPTRYMFMACREDFWQGNRQVKLHSFSPSTVNQDHEKKCKFETQPQSSL